MKNLLLISLLLFSATTISACSENNDTSFPDTEQPESSDLPSGNSKTLVAYFSATGTTQAIAERITELTGADIYRINAADPYATNPYDDTERIQNEAYNDLRPGVANLPDKEAIAQYDTIFVCTFLENYDLGNKVIIPFITYGATTYLNESMQKIYKVTPESIHIPATLPEDLDPENIREPQNDDAGIDMPNGPDDVEAWLLRIKQSQ